jgi:NAD(P)-dependent dehydrogenase (short-subunit alcohol dehydrogenase family)
VNIEGEPGAYRKAHAGFGEGHPETRSARRAGGRRMPTLQAMAKLFAAEGAKVVCADISGNQEAVAADIGAAAVPIHIDVAREDDVRKMIATAEERFGRLDILVNNAGFGGKMAPLHEQTVERWDQVHSVNIRGVFFGMKYGITSMLKTGGGAIVNISSASGLVGWKHHSIYGAAKAGVNQLTKSAALDYAGQKIRVNAVLPGTMWTGLVKQSKEFPEPAAGHLQTARHPDGPLGPGERHRLRRAVPGKRRSLLRHGCPATGGWRLLHRIFWHGGGKYRSANWLNASSLQPSPLIVE